MPLPRGHGQENTIANFPRGDLLVVLLRVYLLVAPLVLLLAVLLRRLIGRQVLPAETAHLRSFFSYSHSVEPNASG